MPRWLTLLCCSILLLAGCPPAESDRKETTPPPAGVVLRVAVVDDEALADAVALLEGEWSGQTGTGFQVIEMSRGTLPGAESLDADLIVFPSGWLGTLAERGLICPLSSDLLDEEQAGWSEVFDLLRLRETVWGSEVVAVPFGSPVLTCYYRADLLESLGSQPPTTWSDYLELATLLADRERFVDAGTPIEPPWYGTIEPLGPGWAGQTLLTRAAAYASHRENYSRSFDIETMEPLIDGPPFVRALEELVEAARLGPPDQRTYDPAAVRAAFWQGRCGLALSWPTAASDLASSGDGFPVGFAELPGSPDVYDVANAAWETRREGEDPHVPLIGISGRMGGVVSTSQWPTHAAHLLLWLSNQPSNRPPSQQSPATTLYRVSHVESPLGWVEEPMPSSAAAEYARGTQQTLSRPEWLFSPRIPGRDEYLAALDAAVHRAIRDEAMPEASLQRAATQWREITERLGVESQKAAYWHSLGLD